MDNPKHTPGPWRYEESTKTIRAVPSNYWLATMDSWDRAVSNQANARLIAAAPEMLDALQLALNLEGLCEWAVYKQEQIGGPLAGLDVRAHFKPIRDAIRKATGGE